MFLSAVLTASRARHETRGALLRTDYPEADDGAWLKNSRLELGSDGGWSLSHRPVEG